MSLVAHAALSEPPHPRNVPQRVVSHAGRRVPQLYCSGSSAWRRSSVVRGSGCSPAGSASLGSTDFVRPPRAELPDLDSCRANYPLLISFAIVLGVSHGGIIALSPAVVAQFFGTVGGGCWERRNSIRRGVGQAPRATIQPALQPIGEGARSRS